LIKCVARKNRNSETVYQSMDEKDLNSSTVQKILDLLYAAGFVHTTDSDAPPSEKVAAGLSQCIAAITQVSLSPFFKSIRLRFFLHSIPLTRLAETRTKHSASRNL